MRRNIRRHTELRFGLVDHDDNFEVASLLEDPKQGSSDEDDRDKGWTLHNKHAEVDSCWSTRLEEPWLMSADTKSRVGCSSTKDS